MEKTKGIIYYTDNRVVEPIFSKVQEILTKIGKEKGLPITCVSLAPVEFGDRRFVFDLQRGYITYLKQIIKCLELAEEDYVFFCENDVLYHQSHFDFNPPRDDVFYYNNNVWRWKLWDFKLIKYDNMRPLSCLCVNRKFALDHYKRRMKAAEEMGLDEFRSREPRRGRIWGYEPGTKKRRRGGFSDDESEMWTSEGSNIDIRHRRTFTSIKCDLKDFKNKPNNWQEIKYNELKDWDLVKVFPEGMRDNCELDFDKI